MSPRPRADAASGGRGGLRPLGALSLALAVVGSCSPQAGATFEEGVERQPGPGWIHVVTQPASAEIDLVFVLTDSAGDDSSIRTVVAAGERAAFDLITLPGPRAIRMNGDLCQNRFPVEEDRQTEIVVRITADGCATAVIRIRDAEEMRQP